MSLRHLVTNVFVAGKLKQKYLFKNSGVYKNPEYSFKTNIHFLKSIILKFFASDFADLRTHWPTNSTLHSCVAPFYSGRVYGQYVLPGRQKHSLTLATWLDCFPNEVVIFKASSVVIHHKYVCVCVCVCVFKFHDETNLNWHPLAQPLAEKVAKFEL